MRIFTIHLGFRERGRSHPRPRRWRHPWDGPSLHPTTMRPIKRHWTRLGPPCDTNRDLLLLRLWMPEGAAAAAVLAVVMVTIIIAMMMMMIMVRASPPHRVPLLLSLPIVVTMWKVLRRRPWDGTAWSIYPWFRPTN